MSLFSKALASIGVGSAKVDTRLEKAWYRQGEWIRGEVFVQGGQVVQEIDEIHLYLVVRYTREGGVRKHVIEQYRLSETFAVGPDEVRRIPFEFELPCDTPVTTGSCRIYLKTGVDIRMGVDPSDRDGIEVLPHPLTEKVLQAVENLGFELTRIDLEHDRYYSRLPFVQEFCFVPIGGFRGLIDELKLVCFAGEEAVDVLMKIDRKVVDFISSLEEALQLDERIVRFSVLSGEVEEGTAVLVKKIAAEISRQIP